MKVYISADMEGVGDVVHRDDVDCDQPSSHHFALARAQFTAEVNAAVTAALDSGATDVLVNDSHGSMRNLLPDELDRHARLIRGPVKSGLMMAGLDRSFDAAVLIGYHSRAGMPGVLSHTLSGANLGELRLDGEPIGEIGLSTYLAAEHGVPVVFVSGDQDACAEAARTIPGVSTFSTKEALDRIAAICVSPADCCDGIAAGVSAALAGGFAPTQPTGAHRISATFNSVTAATLGGWIPGCRQIDPRTVEFDCTSITAGVDLLVVMLFAAAGATHA